MANGDRAGRQWSTRTIGFLQCGHRGGGRRFFLCGFDHLENLFARLPGVALGLGQQRTLL